MSEVIDTYWSFRSPYSYLATPGLLKLREDYDVEIALRIVLPLAIRAPEKVFDPDNLKPMLYIVMDSQRRAEYLGIPFTFPARPDPVVQDWKTLTVPAEQPYIYRLCKLGVEAQRRGKGLEVAAVISRLIMGGTENWHEGDHLADAVASTGLDLAELDAAIDQGDHLANAVASAGLQLDELDAAIDNGDHMAEIERNHAALEAAGHWGVPTMVVRDEPFFGQDRIDTLRWRLDQYGLKK